MTLKERILEDMKVAMKSKQKDRLRVLRSLKAKLMEREIDERKGGEATLTDEQALDVLVKAAKQRRESIEQFGDAGRDELVQQEEEELEIIESYLPETLSEEEVRNIVKKAISDTGASGMSDMGRVMGQLVPKLKGQADGSVISRLVKEELNG
ncbi:MAG: GatB/YqeY domain-containing protein [Bacteroidota bacterium]